MLSKEFMDKYISQEDCTLYIPIAYRMFYHFNGTVNTMFKFPMFSIVPFSTTTEDTLTYGMSISHDVIIYLGNIIKSYDRNLNEIKIITLKNRRHDYICSVLAITIVHELYHTDQLRYIYSEYISNAPRYHIEGATDRKVYDFFMNNGDNVGALFGFTFMYDILSWDDYNYRIDPLDYDYKRLPDLKEIYSQMLNMSIFKDWWDTGTDIFSYYGDSSNIVMNIISNVIGYNNRVIVIKNNSIFIESGVPQVAEFLQYLRINCVQITGRVIESEFGLEINILVHKSENGETPFYTGE